MTETPNPLEAYRAAQREAYAARKRATEPLVDHEGVKLHFWGALMGAVGTFLLFAATATLLFLRYQADRTIGLSLHSPDAYAASWSSVEQSASWSALDLPGC